MTMSTINEKLKSWSLIIGIIGGVLGIGGTVWGYFTNTENIKLKKQITHLVEVLDQKPTYLRAMKLIERTAKDGGKIINLRSTRDTSLQNKLYDTIVSKLKGNSNFDFTRVITYDSDPHLWVLRRFLEELGDKEGFTLVYTYAAQTMPSAFISEDEVILGLLGKNREVKHGLVITKPISLIERFRDMYEELYEEENSLTVIVKAKNELVSVETIDMKLKELVDRGKELGKDISRWQENEIPVHLKGKWISTLD